MIQALATLIARELSGAAQELRLRAPELTRQLAPGQAVLVRGGWGADPYLRRTFYPIALNHESWTLRVPPTGDWAQAWLRVVPVGATLDCIGPVGNGFRLRSNARNVLCIGEGEPAWALLPAILEADAAGMAVAFAMEAGRERDLISSSRLPARVEYYSATPDSAGRGRLALSEMLAWADMTLAAGSTAFYARLVSEIEAARFAVTDGFAQVLYPATFLCGYGACQACVADVGGGRRRVCQRGPVLDLKDVMYGG